MLNDKLLLVGVAALSTVATAGWMRRTPASTIPAAYTMPVVTQDDAARAQLGVYHQPGVLAPQSQIANPKVTQVAMNQSRRRARNVYDDRRVYDDRPVVEKRSTGESVAIIGGGAAAGAAIGGLAGGGKGAAIGALTGGAGGLVYDRMTRNKKADSYRTNRATYPDDRNRRSTGESVAIIGGGAAAGAAIGGLARGGKGAAIGALGGGAAGLIYDRMTKNK